MEIEVRLKGQAASSRANVSVRSAVNSVVNQFAFAEVWEVLENPGTNLFKIRKADGTVKKNVSAEDRNAWKYLTVGSRVVVVFENFDKNRPKIISFGGNGAYSINEIRLPSFDWIQSLASPYLCLSKEANLTYPSSGVSTAATIAQDPQAAAGMERLLGIVSMGDCYAMVSYRANASLTGFDWMRIRAYEWNHSLRWNTVLGITSRTNAELSNIVYSSNLFWDELSGALITLDFEARAWLIPNTSSAPTTNKNRSGPFRRLAGYAPGGSMLHHNGAQLIHYPYKDEVWGVLPDVKIHNISDLDFVGHSLFNSGSASTGMIDTQRFPNRPWAWSEGFWYAVFSSRTSGSSCMNFVKISSETGEVVVNTNPKFSSAPLSQISRDIHNSAQSSGIPSSFGGTANGSGITIYDGNNLDFEVYDKATLSYIGLSSFPAKVSFSGIASSSTKITQEDVSNPDYPPGLATVPSWDYVNDESLGGSASNLALHFKPLPQSSSLDFSSDLNTGSLFPNTLINGSNEVVFPHLGICAYSWKAVNAPPLQGIIDYGFTINLDEYFALTNPELMQYSYFVTPDFPPGAPPVEFIQYEAHMNASLLKQIEYHTASFLSYFSTDGEFISSVEVTPRIPSFTGPQLDGARNFLNDVVPQWTDLVSHQENIWQVAAGMKASVKNCEFVLHDARENVNAEPRVMLTVVRNKFVVWRSSLLGNQERHATTETNVDLQEFFPGKYKFKYSGMNIGIPSIRLWTKEDGTSYVIVGIWTRKTTDGTNPDTSASNQYLTEIMIYDVTSPANPVLVKAFTESNNSQGSVSLPKSEDFIRMIIRDDQIFWISKVGSDFKIQNLI